MSAMVRKTVYIEPRQDALLKRWAGETGMTESAIIREAIDRYTSQALGPTHNLEAWKRQRAFIQQLIDQGPIGRAAARGAVRISMTARVLICESSKWEPEGTLISQMGR